VHYRDRKLRGLVVTAGLEDNVLFNKTFMPDEELWERLMSSHMYLNSYVDEVASVSGALLPLCYKEHHLVSQ
jgi:hypothetical protein